MSTPLEGSGKGDTQRPTDKKKFDATMDRISGDFCRFPHVHGPECKLKPEETKDKNEQA